MTNQITIHFSMPVSTSTATFRLDITRTSGRVWAIQVDDNAGGSTHWWATRDELTSWLKGRDLMQRFSDALVASLPSN